MEEIEGLHEIHITIYPSDIFALRMYCLDYKIKPILAISAYGDNPIQPMLSKFKNGSSSQVIKRAKEMVETMREDYGILPVRVKVEAMIHNKGVPEGENSCNNDNYFEFHLKIIVNHSNEWNRLANICSEKGAHLSFNAFKKETEPLVTLRLPGQIGSIRALQIKDELMVHLKKHGFHSNSSIQSEYSVYDSNIQLDSGWLTRN